jgi:hypothetical protein
MQTASLKTEYKDIIILKTDSELSNSLINNSNKMKLYIDTSINNKYFLRNQYSFSFANELSASAVERIKEFPIFCFINNDSTEYFFAFQYEGDVKFQFSGFEIGKTNNDILKLPNIKLNDSLFYTSNGIHLEMTKDALMAVYPDAVLKYSNSGDSTVYCATLNDQTSSFLKRYKMPSYFFKCQIKNSKVSKIVFGFDYP